MGAVTSLIIGFILKSANERPQKETPQKTENPEVNASTPTKPKGLMNFAEGDGMICFINALFQTIINDRKLTKDISEIGSYTIGKKEDKDVWDFVSEAFQNYEKFTKSLSPMRGFALDDRTKSKWVMGDPQELLQGMLKHVPTNHPREGEKPFFQKDEIQKFKSFYFEEVRVIQWKKSEDQSQLEEDNKKSEEQKKKDFSLFKQWTKEALPSWCFSAVMEKSSSPLALSQMLTGYFKSSGPKDKIIKKALDENSNVVRVENVSEHVELGQEKPLRFFLHLKRFVTIDEPTPSTTASSKMIEEGTSHKQDVKIEKIDTPIPIEETFLKQLEENTQTPYRVTLEQNGWKNSYVLQSVILHSNWGGKTIERGHYTTLARNDGVWWIFDDTRVTQATKDDIKKYLSEGYLYQFNLEEPVQEAGKIVISNVNEQPNHQDNEGNN